MSKKVKKIIVNMLSSIRIIGSIVLPFLFLKVNTVFLICLLFLIFLTDFFDGFLAKRWGVQTVGGKILDPVGDKLIIITSLLSLGKINKNLFILLMIEIVIGIISTYRVMDCEKTKASLVGRIKTWFVAGSILMVMLNELILDGNLGDIVELIIAFTILIELITVYSYLRVIDDPKRKKQKKDKKIEYKNLKEILSRLFDENAFQEDCNKPIIELLKK